jgi:hypothetical protein
VVGTKLGTVHQASAAIRRSQDSPARFSCLLAGRVFGPPDWSLDQGAGVSPSVPFRTCWTLAKNIFDFFSFSIFDFSILSFEIEGS